MRALLLLAALLPVRAAAASARRVEVRLDPRVELAAALHLEAAKTGPLDGFAADGSPYARALEKIAGAAPGHPAIDAYRREVRRPAVAGGGFMTPLRELTVCLDDRLVLAVTTECARSPLAGPAAAFAAATSFAEKWEKDARPLLDAEVAALSAERDRADYLALFEEYAGLPALCSYEVAPSPLLGKGLFWNGHAEAVPGRECAITTVLSPARPASAGPKARFDWLPVMRDVWHENGHALLDAWLDATPSTGVLTHPGLTGAALEGCYGSWPQCVREHAAQGLSAAILEWAEREKRLPAYADEHLKKNLPLLPKVVARFKEYEADRRRYPDLRAFYPRVLAVLEGAPASTAAARVHAREASRGGADRDAGVAAFAGGKLDEAAAAFSRAVASDPRLAEAWLSLAVTESARGRAPAARAAADKAVALARADGELPPGFLSDALSTRAEQRARAGDAAGARADLVEALDAAPSDWPRAAELRERVKGR